jgi:transcriptional regulator with XRE-family HTH domain
MTQVDDLLFAAVADDAWSQQLTRGIAREIRRHRDRLNLSAQEVSDKSKDLGYPIPRTVIANLESGRRPMITLAELLVLAAVLEVSPIQLIAPAGFVDEMQPLPDWEAATIDVLDWLRGKKDLGLPLRVPPMFEALTLYIEADEDLLRYSEMTRHAPASASPEWVNSMSRALEEVRKKRGQIRRFGMEPPPLPLGFRHLDAASSSSEAEGQNAPGGRS